MKKMSHKNKPLDNSSCTSQYFYIISGSVTMCHQSVYHHPVMGLTLIVVKLPLVVICFLSFTYINNKPINLNSH